jgi:hypothetical protein
MCLVPKYIPSEITDESLKTLTDLTELHLHASKVTGSCLAQLTNLTTLKLADTKIPYGGIKNLINLTYLDLTSYWKMRDDWLIDEKHAPRHPKLKKLLLPLKHKITDHVIDILEEKKVEVEENEYTIGSDNEDENLRSIEEDDI